MKTSLESMKTISEKKFKTVDFDTKNEFFYNNAYTIIKSNKLFNGNNYMDILETMNSNIKKKNKRKKKLVTKKEEIFEHDDPIKSDSKTTKRYTEKKSSIENRENYQDKKKTQSHEQLKIRNKNLKFKFKSENFTKNSTEMNEIRNLTSDENKKLSSTPEKKIKISENKKFQNQNQYSNANNNQNAFRNISIMHTKSNSITVSNLKTFTSNSSSNNLQLLTFPNNQKPFSNPLTKDEKFFYSTSNLEKRKINNRNNSLISYKNISTESSKNFIEDINKVRDKYLHKFHEKYLASSNNFKTLLNELKETDPKSSKFETTNEIKFDKIHSDTNQIFQNYLTQIINKYNQENKNTDYLENDLFEIRLKMFDELEHSLPEYSKVITKMRKALTKIEKRKVVVNYKNLELGEKLDDLISKNKSKLDWDFSHLKINCLPMEFQRKILRNEDFFENLMRKLKKFGIRKNKSNGSDDEELENWIKPKYKSVGKAKVLIIPKEMKKDKEIYEDSKVFQIEKIRNEVKEVLSPKTTNIKVKKIYDNLSNPKGKSHNHSKREIHVSERILSDYEAFERNNLKLVNQIKNLKKKFKLESLYVDPNWAIEELKS
jgi:hypothetical protein